MKIKENLKIAVVGCGSLGSFVCYSICLRSLITPIDKLLLIDNDILEEKNLPYVFITDKNSDYINNPKLLALKDCLEKINPYLNIEAFYDIYRENKIKDDYIIVDCRDVSDKQKFHIKASCDGPYCKILRKPDNDQIGGRINSYLFENSKYYSLRASIEVCEQIFTYPENEKSYVMDFTKNLKLDL